MVVVNGHHCSHCDETDYLSQCSGGKGPSYRVNNYARDKKKCTRRKYSSIRKFLVFFFF